MSDDAKEWKTVKIEAPVRDDAQADPRTYSEIMRAGLQADTTDLYQPGEADPVDAASHPWPAPDADGSALPDDLADQLDRIEDAAREATNAAQNAERAAEELAGQR